MRTFKKICLAAGVAIASLFAGGSTAEAQVAYSPYYGYNYGYPYGYGARNFGYNVTVPLGSNLGYTVTIPPGYYGGYGYSAYKPTYPYVWPTPEFGRGSYSYMYPGVFYSPGSYTFFGY